MAMLLVAGGEDGAAVRLSQSGGGDWTSPADDREGPLLVTCSATALVMSMIGTGRSETNLRRATSTLRERGFREAVEPRLHILEWPEGTIAPWDPDRYRHNETGEDNAHLRSLTIGHEVIVPITAGKPDLGP